MKGYLSVSGGIIHLLIELTPHTAPSKSPETKTFTLAHGQLPPGPSHSPPPPFKHSGSLPSPTHTPPSLCLSESEHSLFAITLSHPSVYLFIHCKVLYP